MACCVASAAPLVAAAAAPSTAGAPERRPLVLVLHSYGPGQWVNNLQRGLLQSLSGDGTTIDLSVDYMDARRIEAPEYLEQLRQLYQLKYRDHRFDLVIVCDDPAYRFSLAYHRTLWPGAPIVFCGLDRLPPAERLQQEGFTGISENDDLAPLLRSLPRLLPKLTRLLVIADDTPYANGLYAQVAADLSRLGLKVRPERLNSASTPELIQRLEHLGADEAVLYLSLWRDRDGRFIPGSEIQRILQHSTAPVLAVRDAFVGHGVTGSSFVDGEEHGLAVGRIARRILAGELPAAIPAQHGPPRRITFDALSLVRFHLDARALPPGAVIINAPFSFYRQYRTIVWVTAGIIASLAALVGLLVINIARRRHAVAQLQDSERKFHAIFDQTFQLAGLLDTDGRLLAINHTALQFAGCREEEVRGRFFWETPWWVHDTSQQERTKQAVHRAAQGELVRFETKQLNAVGELRTIDFSIKPIFGPGGRVLHLLPEGRDITDTRHTEENLHSVLDSAPLILWTTDAAGVFTMSIGSGLRLIGHRPNQTVGRSVFDVYGGLPQLVDAGHRVLAGESMRMVLKIRDRCFDAQISPQLDDNGILIGTRGIALDVTENLQAQATRLQLATAVEQAAEAIILTDARGVIQYVNPAFEKITGYTRAETVGQSPRLLKSGRQDEHFYRELWKTLAAGRVWAGRFANSRKDGTSVLEDTTITPLLGDDGAVQGYVAVQRDVTAQVQLEDTLRHTQRLEAIGKLAGGVAHDFNNILQVIKANVAFSRELTRDQQELDDYLAQIDQAATRAAGLTRQLLAFGRKQALQFQVIEPAAAVADVLKLIRRLIGAHIEVEFHAEPGLALLRADTGQLEQVVLNLCVNARDAMPQGGRLTIHLRNATLAAAELPREDALRPGRFVELTVSDTGVGMDPETTARIFEPFFTTKPVSQGTGLGLSVVQGIVHQHEGFIQVSSQRGRGTTFRVYLPAAQGNLPTAPAEPVVAPPRAVSRHTLLLAEDDPAVRFAATRILENHGYRLIVAVDGEEACALAAARLDEIALAVFDVVMPKLSGIEAAKRLRQLKPGLPVILCSGYASGLPDGGLPQSTLVPKPYTADELLAAIEACLPKIAGNSAGKIA